MKHITNRAALQTAQDLAQLALAATGWRQLAGGNWLAATGWRQLAGVVKLTGGPQWASCAGLTTKRW